MAVCITSTLTKASVDNGVTIATGFLVLGLPYFLWIEKDLHFYRDYTYTYLLSALPITLIELCVITWRTMQQVVNRTIQQRYFHF
jgi:hypothetical protein